MRKANGILTIAILVLFLLHGILGSFQLLGSGHVISKALSHTLLLLVLIHSILGIVLTVKTLRTQRRAGVAYWRENRLFWARRCSGFVLLVLLAFHANAFGDSGGAFFRLQPFDAKKLAAQVLLVAALAVHLLTNCKPLLITFGVRRWRKRAGDILFILSVLLLFMTLGFIVYYLRWQRI